MSEFINRIRGGVGRLIAGDVSSAWGDQEVVDGLITPAQYELVKEAQKNARRGAFGGHIGASHASQINMKVDVDGGDLGLGVVLIDVGDMTGTGRVGWYGSGMFAKAGGAGFAEVRSVGPDGQPGPWIAAGNANNPYATLDLLQTGANFASNMNITLPAIMSPYGEKGFAGYFIAAGAVSMGADGYLDIIAMGGGQSFGAEAFVEGPYGRAMAQPDLPEDGYGDADSYAKHAAFGVNLGGSFQFNGRGPHGNMVIKLQPREKQSDGTWKDLPAKWVGLGVDLGRIKGGLPEDKVFTLNGSFHGGHSGAGIKDGTGEVTATLGQISARASGIQPRARTTGAQGAVDLNFGIDIEGPSAGVLHTQHHAELYKTSTGANVYTIRHPSTGKEVPVFGFTGLRGNAIGRLSSALAFSMGAASALYNPDMAEKLVGSGLSDAQINNILTASVSIETPYCLVTSRSSPTGGSMFQ